MQEEEQYIDNDSGAKSTNVPVSANNNFIKNIWLELPEYRFSSSKDKLIWLGRKDISDKLQSYLRITFDDKSDKWINTTGAYLITGYRGMGKTVFVERVIEEYKEAQEEQRKKWKR